MGRGFLVGLFQRKIVIGILVGYVSNFAIGQLAGGDLVWRLKLGIAAAPAALFLVMLLHIPHSPRWLVEKGRHDEAHPAIAALNLGQPAAMIESFRTVPADPPEGRQIGSAQV